MTTDAGQRLIEDLRALADACVNEMSDEEMLREAADEIERLRGVEADKNRLDAIAAEYWKIDPFEMPTGAGDADVGWRVVQYHQGKPEERTVAEVYTDDPRKAIDAAIAASRSTGAADVGEDRG